MIDLFPFLSNYIQSQVNEIVDIVTNLQSPFYTYLFLAIFIKIYRT